MPPANRTCTSFASAGATSAEPLDAETISAELQEAEGRLPDTIIAAIGGGSNAMGLFHPFLEDESVRLIGVEAAGKGIETGEHAASLNGGTPGAAHLHVARTVCRRAERLVVALATTGAEDTDLPVRYLNRLSDWLFVAARVANLAAGGDVLWVPGASR